MHFLVRKLPVGQARVRTRQQRSALLSEVSSPCVLVCSIDLKSGFCFGCGRTRDEIAAWMDYTDAQRNEITAALPERLQTIERKPRRITRRRRMAQRRADELTARS